MEIITTEIPYDEKRHSTIEFLKKYFARMAVSMMNHDVIESMINRNSIEQSMQEIITTKWNYTRMVGSMVAGQSHLIELIDDAWIHVYLLENAKRDKLVMYISGQHNNVLSLDLGYVGNPDTFKQYTDVLTITDIEVYANAVHLVEEDVNEV